MCRIFLGYELLKQENTRIDTIGKYLNFDNKINAHELYRLLCQKKSVKIK